MIRNPVLFINEAILSGTAGSVLFADSVTGLLGQDNTNLFYDRVAATLRVPTIAGDTASSTSLNLLANTQTFAGGNTGRVQIGERVTFNGLNFTISSGFSDSIISSNAITTSNAGTCQFPFLLDSRVYNYSVNQLLSFSPTMQCSSTFTPTANGIADASCLFSGFLSTPNYIVNVGAGNSASTSSMVGYTGAPKAGPRTSGSGTVTNLTAFQSWGFNFFTDDIYANNTVTNLVHLNCGSVLNVGTVGTQTFLNIPNNSVGTNINGIASALATASNKFFINHSGTAHSLHVGLFRFGDTTDPTAVIDLASGQTNHIRMAGHTAAPASPTAGDIYYDTTQKTHQFQTTAGKEGNVGLLSSNTSDSGTISNTTSETNFSLNFQLPANCLTANKVIRVRGSGIFSTILTPTLNFRLKYGTVNLLDFGAISAGTALSNRAFSIDAYFIVRTAGATGTVMAAGNIILDNAVTSIVTGVVTTVNNAGTTTIDTTTATNLQISAQWSAASLTNATILENFVVEALG